MSDTYPDAARLERARRPQRTRCPQCHQPVRLGYRAGEPVVGQHWRTGHPGPTADGEHGTCCPCPGSWQSVDPADAWDFLQTRALTATGSFTAVPPRSTP